MIDQIFKAHPEAKCYFKTSDGFEFFKQNDANNHAKTLTDKKVLEVKNPSFIEVASETVSNSEKTVSDEEKAQAEADAKANAEAKQKSADAAKTKAAAKAKPATAAKAKTVAKDTAKVAPEKVSTPENQQ